MNSVILIPKVLEYIESLIPILYENGYFSFADTAIKYVDDLYDDIQSTLPQRLHKPAPPYFDKYGEDMKYAVFVKSKRTSWYVFFQTYEENEQIYYLVRYISNNHIIAQYL